MVLVFEPPPFLPPSRPQTVKTLDLSNNDFGLTTTLTQLTKYLFKSKSLLHLHLAHANISEAGLKRISKALKNNETLQTLNLANNSMWGTASTNSAKASSGPCGCLACFARKPTEVPHLEFMTMLRQSYWLVSLNVAHTKLGDRNAQQLLDALAKNENSVLRDLVLSHNNISETPTILEQLKQLLTTSKTLRLLDISDNHKSATEGLKGMVRRSFVCARVAFVFLSCPSAPGDGTPG